MLSCLYLQSLAILLNLYFSFNYLQNDINLIHAIEAEINKKFEAYECNEKEVLEDITKVALLLYTLFFATK